MTEMSPGAFYADERLVSGSTLTEVDVPRFAAYYEKRLGKPFSENGLPLGRVLSDMRLSDGERLTLTGSLLFTKDQERRLSALMVKATVYSGTQMAEADFLDAQDIVGRLSEVFEQTVCFLTENTQYRKERAFADSRDIAKGVWAELIVNALLHRDYDKAAPIRVLVFADRVEIASPGCLPHQLSVEHIRLGAAFRRNQTLTSHAAWMLPYRGLGNGVLSVLKLCPDTIFINNKESDEFRVIVKRKSLKVFKGIGR